MSFKPDSHWKFLSVNYGPEDDNLANAAAALLVYQLINHLGQTGGKMFLYSHYKQL